MVALILAVVAARADDTLAHVSVSTGWQALPGVVTASSTPLSFGGFTRLEVGAGPDMAQGYVVAQLAIHDAVDAFSASSSGAPVVLVGDAFVGNFGVGARMPVALWRALRVAPHADVGVVTVGSPIPEGAYLEMVEDLGGPPTVGRSGLGLWAQVGGDVAVPVIEDAVDAFISADVGYLPLGGMGLTVGARAGLAARF